MLLGRWMMMMNDLQLVRVTWIDAHAVTVTWHPVDELDDEPCVVQSVGFLLPDVKTDHVTLAQSLIEANDEVDHVLSIPVGMVRRLEKLLPSTVLPVEPV